MDEIISMLMEELTNELAKRENEEAKKPQKSSFEKLAWVSKRGFVTPRTSIEEAAAELRAEFLGCVPATVKMSPEEVIDTVYNLLVEAERRESEECEDYEEEDYEDEECEDYGYYEDEGEIEPQMPMACVAIEGDSLMDALAKVGLTGEEIQLMMTTRTATPAIMEKFKKAGVVVM